jgi:hypothetical protein
VAVGQTLGSITIHDNSLDSPQLVSLTGFASRPTLIAAPAAGTCGTQVKLSFSGFASYEYVSLSWAGQSLGTLTANQKGAGSKAVNVPAAALGTYTFTAAGATSHFSAGAAFQLNPSLRLSPATGLESAAVGLTVCGYAAGETIHAYWDSTSGTLLGSAPADATGSAAITYLVPYGPGGLHTVIVVGATSGVSTSAHFLIQPTLSEFPKQGYPGSTVAVSGRNYAANEQVLVNFQGQSGVYATADGNGNFGPGTTQPAAVLTVPNSTFGRYWPIYGTGQSSGAQAFVKFFVQ